MEINKIYKSWNVVPRELKTQTQWKCMGCKVKKEATPSALFCGMYQRTYGLYPITDTAKIRKIKPVVIPETLTYPMILEALYVINKNVKNISKKETQSTLYKLKESVITRLISENQLVKKEWHRAGPYDNEDREYIIRSNYESEDEYFEALKFSTLDEKERPYISGGVRQCYDLFVCHYFENDYSFHTPIQFRVSKFPLTLSHKLPPLPLESFLPLVEEGHFKSERKCGLKNITLSKKILEKYVSKKIGQ